jgi:hypothetical protein
MMIDERVTRFDVLYTSSIGVAHRGSAEVNNGFLRVYYDNCVNGSYLGSNDPAVLARLLLKALVQKAEQSVGEIG